MNIHDSILEETFTVSPDFIQHQSDVADLLIDKELLSQFLLEEVTPTFSWSHSAATLRLQPLLEGRSTKSLGVRRDYPALYESLSRLLTRVANAPRSRSYVSSWQDIYVTKDRLRHLVSSSQLLERAVESVKKAYSEFPEVSAIYYYLTIEMSVGVIVFTSNEQYSRNLMDRLFDAEEQLQDTHRHIRFAIDYVPDVFCEQREECVPAGALIAFER